MTGQPPRKHLPVCEWPVGDELLFQKAFIVADIFDDARGAGAHLSEGTRKTIHFGWRRWLGFLKSQHPDALLLPAADRITPAIVRAYVKHLRAEMLPSSVATTVAQLYNAARILASDRDWNWLKGLKRRLDARAPPKDRFERLVPAHRTLDLGISLMETAVSLPRSGRMEREIQFRDGLILAVLSLWPIRRRSLAALTHDRHVKRMGYGRVEIVLFPEDTKSKRQASWPVPDILLPYLRQYLDDVRPRLTRGRSADALWVGQKGSLRAGAIYDLVCRRTANAYQQTMSPHDLRRAAATFLAMDAPENVGLTPGVLQHLNPETSARHYNLARSTSASRRHSETLSALKARLRSGKR